MKQYLHCCISLLSESPELSHSLHVHQWEDYPDFSKDGWDVPVEHEGAMHHHVMFNDSCKGMDFTPFDEIAIVTRYHALVIKKESMEFTADYVTSVGEFFKRFCLIADGHAEEDEVDHGRYEFWVYGNRFIVYDFISNYLGCSRESAFAILEFTAKYCVDILTPFTFAVHARGGVPDGGTWDIELALEAKEMREVL